MNAQQLKEKRMIRKFLREHKATKCPLSYGEAYNYHRTIPPYALGVMK